MGRRWAKVKVARGKAEAKVGAAIAHLAREIREIVSALYEDGREIVSTSVHGSGGEGTANGGAPPDLCRREQHR